MAPARPTLVSAERTIAAVSMQYAPAGPCFVAAGTTVVAAVAFLVATGRPQCGRDREFKVQPSPTATAALQPSTSENERKQQGR